MNIIEGNILDVADGVICHQVNCMGKMGAGLASQIKSEYPEVYERYKSLCYSYDDRDRFNLLGQIQVVPVDQNKWVVNLFGQYDTGGERATDYCALATSLGNLQEWVSKTGEVIWHKKTSPIPVYLPFKIGCGLGGGDWGIVKSIIYNKLPKAKIVRKRD